MKVKLSNQKDIKVAMTALYTRKHYLEKILNTTRNINRKEYFEHELTETIRVLKLFEKEE